MTRFLALLLLAAATPAAAANPPRNFSVTGFDQVRIEGPYAVTLVTGKGVSARAEGSPAALDGVDLRVENRTLILRQRSNAVVRGTVSPVRIFLSAPDVRKALLVGSGTLAIDKMTGLSVEASVQGSGALSVASVTADRVIGSALGSGALTLSGKTKTASLVTRGLATIAAGQLAANEVSLTADGAATAAINAQTKATIEAVGAATVTVSGNPPCTIRASGSTSISGCR